MSVGVPVTTTVLSIFGTRPEAIKMAPVIQALEREAGVTSLVCVTAQHRQMLDQVLSLFEIVPDFDLDIMAPDQGLNEILSRIIRSVDGVLEKVKPDRVLVHGDTTTAMAASIAAFHRRLPVGHVEAGLRTYDLQRPWPEEANRRTIDLVSDMLFAPTEVSAQNLRDEQLQGTVFVTGNTVIDALLSTARRLEEDRELKNQVDAGLPLLGDQPMVLVTGHRRESFGSGFRDICEGIRRLAIDQAGLQIIYPVHMNPNVQGPVHDILSRLPNVHLIGPQEYAPFVRLMQRASVILTDSGGVQEEAPSLGKPVLVMRDVTERPEAVESGAAKLVGTDPARIVSAVFDALDRLTLTDRVASNPYGDGKASSRIAAVVAGREADPFVPQKVLARPMAAV